MNVPAAYEAVGAAYGHVDLALQACQNITLTVDRLGFLVRGTLPRLGVLRTNQPKAVLDHVEHMKSNYGNVVNLPVLRRTVQNVVRTATTTVRSQEAIFEAVEQAAVGAKAINSHLRASASALDAVRAPVREAMKRDRSLVAEGNSLLELQVNNQAVINQCAKGARRAGRIFDRQLTDKETHLVGVEVIAAYAGRLAACADRLPGIQLDVGITFLDDMAAICSSDMPQAAQTAIDRQMPFNQAISSGVGYLPATDSLEAVQLGLDQMRLNLHNP